MIFVVLCYFGPYLLLVFPAYRLVRHYGRPYHFSDWAALLSPMAVYVTLSLCQDRQGWNFTSPTLIIGIVGAVCVLFRGWRRRSPWSWAVGTSILGAITALIVWRTFEREGLTRLF